MYNTRMNHAQTSNWVRMARPPIVILPIMRQAKGKLILLVRVGRERIGRTRCVVIRLEQQTLELPCLYKVLFGFQIHERRYNNKTVNLTSTQLTI